jgi:hypothetical protein
MDGVLHLNNDKEYVKQNKRYHMKKIMDYVKKRQEAFAVLIVLVFVSFMSAKILVGNMEENFQKAAIHGDVVLMYVEIRDMKTVEDVRSRIKYWKDNKWAAQIASYTVVKSSSETVHYFKEYLIEKDVFDQEIFNAFVTYD